MGSEKRAVKINADLLRKLIKEKGSINRAAEIAGYSHPTTFRKVLQNGEIAPERLIRLANYLGVTADKLIDDTAAEEIIFIQHMIDLGLLSVNDNRQHAEITTIEEDLLKLCRDLGTDITPLADGTADYIGTNGTGKIDYQQIQSLFNEISSILKERLSGIEKEMIKKKLSEL